MKKKLIVVLAAMIAATSWTGIVSADDHDSIVFVPVDIFPCTFNEGKGPGDLDAVVAGWNEYMDEQDNDSYAAWTLSKVYTGPDQNVFDFLWLGAHRNGTSMGEGMDRWMQAPEQRAAFEEVANCSGAGHMASRMFKAPPGGNTPSNAVLTFSDCKVKDGASYDDVVAAEIQWAQVLDDAGQGVAIYHWYPVFGGPVEFNYKLIQAYENFSDLGQYYDAMANGGMFRTRQGLMDGLVDCDVARVYGAQSRRAGQIRD